MYKLLTTAAVIMTVATPSFAWTDAKTLIEGLNDVYTGVDGTGAGSHFEGLQKGALGTFVNTVNTGITHITLDVAPDTHLISVSAVPGVTMGEIVNAQDDLINQVNYDLFVDSDTGTVEAYDSAIGYDPDTDTPSNPGAPTIGNGGINGYDSFSTSLETGLVGVKVKSVVDDVNALNTFLIDQTTPTNLANDVVTNINNDAGLNGIEGITGITLNTDITGLNASTTAANNGVIFFGQIGNPDNNVDGNNLSGFQIPGFTVDGTTGVVSDGVTTYTSLLNWAQTAP